MTAKAATKLDSSEALAPAHKVGGIHRKMLNLMEEVGAIPKNRSGQGINYKFRGIDDLYEAVHSGLRKVGVSMIPVMVPGSLKVDVRESTNQSGGVKLNTTVTFELQVTFVDVDDGSTISVLVPAQGTDNSDKAAGKAMSYGMKNALFHVLAIPTEDPDAERPDTTVKPPKASPAAKAAAAKAAPAVEPPATAKPPGVPDTKPAAPAAELKPAVTEVKAKDADEQKLVDSINNAPDVAALNTLVTDVLRSLDGAQQLKLAPLVKARRNTLTGATK